MKTKVYYLKSFVVLFSILIFSSNTGFCQKNVTGEIQGINQKFMNAYKAGDFKTISSLYAVDAKLLPPNSAPISGAETITKVWEGIKSMGVNEIEFKTISAESEGNIAIEEGEYKLFAPDHSIIDNGKYCVIWKMKNNEWKVYKDIWNTNNPPVPRATMNDTVMVITQKIKAEDRQKMLDWTKKYYGEPFGEFYPEVKNRSRLFYSLIPNEDGDIQILYFAEPHYSTDNYNLQSIMGKKYSQEEIQNAMKEYEEITFDNDYWLLKQIDY